MEQNNIYTAPETRTMTEPSRTRKSIKKVDVVRTGIFQGAMTAIIGFISCLIYIPITLLLPSFASSSLDAGVMGMSVGITILLALLGILFYAGLGFIAGAIGALIYNLIAKCTGCLLYTSPSPRDA